MSEFLDAFEGMNREQKTHWIAHAMLLLGSLARDTYDYQSGGVRDPNRLRRFNELGRRLCEKNLEYTCGFESFPDSILLKILEETSRDLGFSYDDFMTSTIDKMRRWRQ